MNWPIPKNVVAVDFSDLHLILVEARYSMSKLIVYKSRAVYSRSREEREKIIKDFTFLPEDVVVYSFPIGSVLFVTLEVPPKVKEKDLIRLGRMEASRTMGIPFENIVVSPVGGYGNRTLFAVAKISDVETFVETLMGMGLPEPDVVFPDPFKYLLATSVPIHGNVIYILANFFKNYVVLLLVVEGRIVGIRTINLELSSVFLALEERFDLSLPEVAVLEDVRGMKDVNEFLGMGFVDLGMEITREYTMLLRTGLVEIQPGDVDLVVLMTEPHGFAMPLLGSISDNVSAKIEVENVKGVEGLLRRGGSVFGKVKSVLQEI